MKVLTLSLLIFFICFKSFGQRLNIDFKGTKYTITYSMSKFVTKKADISVQIKGMYLTYHFKDDSKEQFGMIDLDTTRIDSWPETIIRGDSTAKYYTSISTTSDDFKDVVIESTLPKMKGEIIMVWLIAATGNNIEFHKK